MYHTIYETLDTSIGSLDNCHSFAEAIQNRGFIVPEVPKTIVLCFHGMGTTKEAGYEKEWMRKVFEYLRTEQRNQVIVRGMAYSIGVQDNQRERWEAMRREASLFYNKWARKFLMYYLSDAATLEHNSDERDSPYRAAQVAIRKELNGLRKQPGVTKDSPIVVLAHSLGCQVFSNFLYDAQKGKGIFANKKASRWEKLENLRFIYTVGCNIPLFVAGFDKILPFEGTGEKWYNYHDRRDVLGWPLLPLKEFRGLVTEDRSVWNPTVFESHVTYFKNKRIAKDIAISIATCVGQ